MIQYVQRSRRPRLVTDILIFIVACAIALLAVRSEMTRIEAIKKAKNLAAQARLVNARQAATIRVLCDRGAILDDLVQGALALVERPPRQPGEDEFIQRFQADHVLLLDQLTRKDSPCNA